LTQGYVTKITNLGENVGSRSGRFAKAIAWKKDGPRTIAGSPIRLIRRPHITGLT